MSSMQHHEGIIIHGYTVLASPPGSGQRTDSIYCNPLEWLPIMDRNISDPSHFLERFSATTELLDIHEAGNLIFKSFFYLQTE